MFKVLAGWVLGRVPFPASSAHGLSLVCMQGAVWGGQERNPTLPHLTGPRPVRVGPDFHLILIVL